jgi:CubicO group peptidase (beta-lactamase class C family)
MNSPNPLSSGEPAALGFLPQRFEPLHRRIQRFIDDGQHAGVSLLLARNGKIADTFATGFRNRELNLPMSRDTIVRVYSMTKIVVSVAALTLLEEGKLGLLDPVTDYLPEFRDLQVLVGGTLGNPELVPADKPLTIQHLFTHTPAAGFSTFFGLEGEGPRYSAGRYRTPVRFAGCYPAAEGGHRHCSRDLTCESSQSVREP